MKLNLVPARTGLQWIGLGMKTFFRQPLAMSGLFFMFMATVSVLQIVPVLGLAISVALVPAATLGLMAATREAVAGRFPMPSVMLTAFRGGQPRTRAMLTLGALYAVGLLMVIGVSALFMGSPPTVDVAQGEVSTEAMRATFDRPGLWASMLIYIPVLMAFWHAPALVFWHGVSPVKSLFFSLLACWSNKGAMLVYTLGWLGVFVAMGLLLGLLGALFGGSQAMSLVLYPAVLLMASLFHTSIWFTFRDSFIDEDTPAPAQGGEPGER